MPTIETFVPRELGPKEWGTEQLIAQTDMYIGKILRMRAGARGPLQYHQRKDETFHLVSGRAIVRYDDGTGTLKAHAMYPGESFHVPPGAVHQVEAIDYCVFFEASNPVFDDRVNVEADYK